MAQKNMFRWLLLLPILGAAEGAHILFIHHLASYSHITTSMPLAEALIERGHTVTYMASVPNPSPNPNITYIVPEGLGNLFKDILDRDFDVTSRIRGTVPNLLLIVDLLHVWSCEALIGSKDFQDWMKTTIPVDLIYVDNLPECAMGIAHKLKSKLAIFLPLPMSPKYFDAFGFTTESSSLPNYTFSLRTPLGFFGRVLSTLNPLAWRFSQIISWYFIRSIIQNHLQVTDLPSLDELHQNVSLIMNNGHFLEEQRRSVPPFVVNVPALHVRQHHGPLSKELKDFVGGPEVEGFVYISFGTVVNAPNMPQSLKEVFFNSISAFPNVRFIWRWKGEIPDKKPDNLLFTEWVNQQDLLGNQRIRGFITQAGRPSLQEALYNAVPVITFPMIADQDYNANVVNELGVSIHLDIGDVTEKQLKNAISKMVYDKALKARCVEVSKLYKDLPMKPIETAVWWTEYVLRHNNTRHLKPLAIDQPWYQRRLLDVWIFLALCTTLLTYLTFRTTRYLVTRYLISTTGKKIKQN